MQGGQGKSWLLLLPGPGISPATSPSVFLQNKARREDFCPQKLRQMHLVIDQLMAHSHLRYKGKGLPWTCPWSYLSPTLFSLRAVSPLPQALCPCCSATSSRACLLTS